MNLEEFKNLADNTEVPGSFTLGEATIIFVSVLDFVHNELGQDDFPLGFSDKVEYDSFLKEFLDKVTDLMGRAVTELTSHVGDLDGLETVGDDLNDIMRAREATFYPAEWNEDA